MSRGLGPRLTTSGTAEPGVSCAGVPSTTPSTTPAAFSSSQGCWSSPTWRRASLSIWVTSSRPRPARSAGTGTGWGPMEYTSETVSPSSSVVPSAGVWLMTRPLAVVSEYCPVDSTSRPCSWSTRVASSTVSPA